MRALKTTSCRQKLLCRPRLRLCIPERTPPRPPRCSSVLGPRNPQRSFPCRPRRAVPAGGGGRVQQRQEQRHQCAPRLRGAGGGHPAHHQRDLGAEAHHGRGGRREGAHQCRDQAQPESTCAVQNYHVMCECNPNRPVPCAAHSSPCICSGMAYSKRARVGKGAQACVRRADGGRPVPAAAAGGAAAQGQHCRHARHERDRGAPAAPDGGVCAAQRPRPLHPLCGPPVHRVGGAAQPRRAVSPRRCVRMRWRLQISLWHRGQRSTLGALWF